MGLKELEQKYVELGVEIESLKLQQEKIGYKDDPIFLLSTEEYEKHHNEIPELRWWWLRSQGCTRTHSVAVNAYGRVFYTGHRVYNAFGNVRPALNLKFLNPLQYKIVSNVAQDGIDRIVACGVTWVQIAESIYIAENPIGFEKFDDSSSDYESSYIRAWLLDWFEERKNW